MAVKTCLLVTDDPDDHQAFSEAISEISEELTVLIVLDSQKALELLISRVMLPDYIFVDLSMHGIRINSFLKIIKNETDLSSISTVVYGEGTSFSKIENREGLTFFNKDYEYSELRNFLIDFLKKK